MSWSFSMPVSETLTKEAELSTLLQLATGNRLIFDNLQCWKTKYLNYFNFSPYNPPCIFQSIFFSILRKL